MLGGGRLRDTAPLNRLSASRDGCERSGGEGAGGRRAGEGPASTRGSPAGEESPQRRRGGRRRSEGRGERVPGRAALPLRARPREPHSVSSSGQGHGDAQRWRTAGPSLLLPHSGSDLRVGEMGLEAAGRAPWHRSRFLKVQDVEVRGNQRCQALGGAVQAMNRGVAKSAPGGTAHTRSSSALRKVAQLESKIMNRKKQMELQNADFRQKPLDEESLSSASSLERSARGKKYLKNYTTASRNTAISNACPMEDESIQSPKKSGTVKQKLGLDTGKKEKREFTENSLEFPSGNENRRVGTSDSKWSGKVNRVFTGLCSLHFYKVFLIGMSLFINSRK